MNHVNRFTVGPKVFKPLNGLHCRLNMLYTHAASRTLSSLFKAHVVNITLEARSRKYILGHRSWTPGMLCCPVSPERSSLIPD